MIYIEKASSTVDGFSNVWNFGKNKTRFLRSCVCVVTNVWMHQMVSNGKHKEKARWEQYKNTLYFLENKNPGRIAYKTATVELLDTHLKKKTSS